MNTLHIGFIGTQSDLSSDKERQVRLRNFLSGARTGYTDYVFHHGDGIGMDSVAHGIASSLGYKIHIHPPNVDTKRAYCTQYNTIAYPKTYMDRNLDIAKTSHILIAMPKNPNEEEIRSGTWSTVRRARKVGTLVLFI